MLWGSFQVVGLMESIEAGRARAQYSRDPLVNDLVLAGVCRLKGQASDRAIGERLPRFSLWLERLEEGFRALESGLSGEVCADLEVGFRHVRMAVEEGLTSQDSLGRLVEATDLLGVLVDWRASAREALAAKYSRWFLPLVGPSVEECFAIMRAQKPAQRARLWRSRVAGLWVALGFWWGQQRELLPLPASFLSEWIPQVDADLAELADWEPEATIEDETLAELTEWVEALVAGFGESRPLMKSVEHLRGGAAGHYYEVIQGLLRDTLPVVAVPALFESANPPEAWSEVVEAMLEYTRGGPRELLYEARDMLLELVPGSAGGGGEDFWVCPFCEQKVATGRMVCAHCGGGASVSLEVRSWNA